MNSILKSAFIAVAALSAATATADDKGRLFIIGSATPGGWELDLAQALISSEDAPAVHTGIIYLQAGEGDAFKFMTDHEWGSTEYGLPADVASTVVSGDIDLASGTLDNGYAQMSVAAAGNYVITVDTGSLKGSVTRAEYQDTEIKYCSLFLIGNATAGGWTVEDGTPLRQVADAPYRYEAVVALKATDNGDPASFKIGTALRGAGSWDAKYYLFRDADDAGKVSTDGTDDRQWSVTEDGDYTVSVNTLTNEISIVKYNGDDTAIDGVEAEADEMPAEAYYDLQGRRVLSPAHGIYLEVRGADVRKVVLP